jgi:hypothetical protein
LIGITFNAMMKLLWGIAAISGFLLLLNIPALHQLQELVFAHEGIIVIFYGVVAVGMLFFSAFMLDDLRVNKRNRWMWAVFMVAAAFFLAYAHLIAEERRPLLPGYPDSPTTPTDTAIYAAITELVLGLSGVVGALREKQKQPNG